jgi:hypothetical protein
MNITRPSRKSALALLIQRFPDTRLTIESLPNEILYYIFTFMRPEDLVRVSQSCRLWYSFVDNRSLWMKHFASPNEQPTITACRWPSRWAAAKRREESERRRQEHDELFVDHPLQVDCNAELEKLRQAFRVLDEYSLMEQ